MTDEELIARLVKLRNNMFNSGNWGADLDAVKDAISCIEAQAAEIERLRDDLAKAMESLGRSKYWTATMSQAAIKAINESMLEKRRADDAEAKLAKAVEALRFYAWENEMRLPNEGPWGTGSTDFGKVARATLAELTGGKDE